MWARDVTLVIALAACGGPAAEPATEPPVTVDPHGSRDALVRIALTRTVAGDVDGLVALTLMRGAELARVLVCEDGGPDTASIEELVRENLGRAARNSKGLAIEVRTIEPESHSLLGRVGDVFSAGCTNKAQITEHRVNATLRVRTAAGDREVIAWINLYEVEGRWYLDGVDDQFD